MYNVVILVGRWRNDFKDEKIGLNQGFKKIVY